MAKLIVVYWRDIPSQVIAKRGRLSVKVSLPGRFQQAIQRAALRAGKGQSDHYLEDWRRITTICSGELQSAADTKAAELVAAHDEALLESIVKANGVSVNGP